MIHSGVLEAPYGCKALENSSTSIENTPNVSDETLTVQNITWADAAPTESTEEHEERMSLMTDPFGRVDLVSALERMINIATVTVDATTIPFTPMMFDPFQGLMSNTYFTRIFSKYKYVRGGMRVKIVVNGCPFTYGKIAASFLPIGQLPIAERAVRALQLNPSLLDYTDSNSVELSWDWVSPFEWHDFSNSANFGSIYLTPLTRLRCTQDVNMTVTINIYAGLVDPEVAGRAVEAQGRGRRKRLTVENPIRRIDGELGVNDPINQEAKAKASQGTISGVVRAVGAAAPLLAPIPYVGQVATVAGPILSVLAPILEGMGFSKPTLNIANSAASGVGGRYALGMTGASNAIRLAYDVDQRLGTGVVPDSQWTWRRIAQVPSLIKSESILSDAVPNQGVPLFTISSSPHGWSWPILGNPSTSCVAAAMFSYWRGSIKLKFQFLCSKFVSARFAVRYSPNVSVLQWDDTLPTYIIDVQGNTETSLVVPYLWRSRVCRNNETPGTIGVFLINSIVGIDPDLASPVDVLVWGAFGDDVQFGHYVGGKRAAVQALPETPTLDIEAQGLWDDFDEPFDSLGEHAQGVAEAGFVLDEQVYDVVTTLKTYHAEGLYSDIADLFLFERGSRRYFYSAAPTAASMVTALNPNFVLPTNDVSSLSTWEIEIPQWYVVPYRTRVVQNAAHTTGLIPVPTAPTGTIRTTAASEDTELGWFIGTTKLL